VRSRWFKLIWVIPTLLVALAIVVLLTRWLRGMPLISDLVHDYPGHAALPAWAPVGFPAWLQWQHGLNAFFLLLIIRTGWQVRTQRRPAAYWTRNNNGPLRTKRAPTKISLMLWLHLSLDSLWVLNGVLFYVLIFSTGQWVRIVPTGWDVFPHAVSTAIQYASLDWPVENGWVNYNALQVISYFLVVFVAAPLAIVTGLRISPIWPPNTSLNRVYPVELARRIHFPTMIFFVIFLIAHVTLILATGALNNLNHMYAGRDDQRWVGLVIFAVSVVVMSVAWVAAQPLFLRPIASRTGRVTMR
jgi:thiosulfate reductase cytochrome b subunit